MQTLVSSKATMGTFVFVLAMAQMRASSVRVEESAQTFL